MKLTEVQIRDYLARLGLQRPASPDLCFLKKIQRAQLCAIPYENLDVLAEVPLSLRPEDLFEKMIARRRGGYCFELNGLLDALLESLGYKVTSYCARFTGGDLTVIPMRRHRVLRVHLPEGDYLADTGMCSETPREPLRLIEGLCQTDSGVEYRYTREPFWGWIFWQKKPFEEFKAIYAFTEEEQTDDDYVMPSFYCEKHPDSPFRQKRMISVFVKSGRVTLLGNSLRTYEGTQAASERELSEAEIPEILESVFKIPLAQQPSCK